MGDCIGFGNFNKKYLYLIYASMCKLIGQLIIGLQYSVLKPIIIFPKEISENSIVYHISCFFFSFIIAMILIKITNNKNMEKNQISNLTERRTSNTNKEILIFNDPTNQGNNLCLIMILVGFCFVFVEVFDQIFYSNDLGSLDYWMVEIFFINFFMRKYLKIDNFLHQKISLLICIISSFILKIISNCLNSSLDEQNNGKPINEYQKIKIKYKSYYFIPLFIISFILMKLIRAFGNTKAKYLIDILYISQNKILLIYGLIGLFFCLIYLIIINIITIKLSYLGNIYNIFERKNIKNIILNAIYLIIYGISYSFKVFFDLLIIRDLNPFYILVKYKIYYLLVQIILLLYGQIPNNTFRIFYFVEVSSDIICFIGFLIFLEIIELKCKGLNYQLKKNIIVRSQIDSLLYIDNDNSFSLIIENEEGESEEEEKEKEELKEL